MARLIRTLRRTLACASFETHILHHHHHHHHHHQPSVSQSLLSKPIAHITRNYISEMRKSAFEGNISRLIRNEIRYELESSPPKQPVSGFNSFTVDDRPGEQWIRLQRKFGADEDIKIEATMFDGSIPAPKSSATEGEVNLHITFIVNIAKGDGDGDGDGDVLEIMCSAWPDTIEIIKLFIRQKNKTTARPYIGPEFKDLDDGLQNSLYAFLEKRGIDDDLAVFLHEYMKNKDKTEFLRWLETVKSYIEKN